MRRRLLNLVSAAGAAFMLAATPVLSEEFPDYSNWNPDSEVDVELVLAVDISPSMDDEEQRIQRAGYIAAITSEEVLRAIGMGPTGRIAVTYMEWAGASRQVVVADWTVIKDAPSAAAFAEKLRQADYRKMHRTSVSGALLRSLEMINGNEYHGLRKVVDISGDGPNNQGALSYVARDRLLEEGVVINGLPLLMKPSKYNLIDLAAYYSECVIGGVGSFQIPVYSTGEFQNAIKAKLVMEIADIRMKKPLVHKANAEVSSQVTCS